MVPYKQCITLWWLFVLFYCAKQEKVTYIIACRIKCYDCVFLSPTGACYSCQGARLILWLIFYLQKYMMNFWIRLSKHVVIVSEYNKISNLYICLGQFQSVSPLTSQWAPLFLKKLMENHFVLISSRYTYISGLNLMLALNKFKTSDKLNKYSIDDTEPLPTCSSRNLNCF